MATIAVPSSASSAFPSASPSDLSAPTSDELLTVDELAAILKCAHDAIYNLTRTRTQMRSEFPIPFLRLPIGLRFSRQDVEEWITAQRINARISARARHSENQGRSNE